jgi:hypothetical protein
MYTEMDATQRLRKGPGVRRCSISYSICFVLVFSVLLRVLLFAMVQGYGVPAKEDTRDWLHK